MRGIGCGVLALLCLAVGIWGGLALWFQFPGNVVARVAVILVWCIPGVWALRASFGPKRRWHSLAVFAAVFALMLVWWATITPRQDRVWADDVAQPLRARIEGNRLLIDNVRDFRWRTEKDYDIAWERREYDLSQVQSVDMILSYWMGPAIAHTLVSFGFADGRQLVFSLEIRKEQHESFSALGGFFRKFEVVLVASDERDIVRVRSNVRGEDVYLYRLHGLSQDEMRALLRVYVEQAQQLEREPRFYNTLTSNCTTVVFALMRGIVPGLPLDYRLLLSGYLAEYAADVGGLTPGVSQAQLQQRGRITQRARDAGDAADFSRRIRQGVPGIPSQGNAP
ncbi:DUF4105 domain-containing protein [Stenotrophomonas sp. SY1]|uniref:Lnb N-terminal periplasmic domain-containing protein n=1 Tax=Stenotrophomonas sp. SY1 TaxID=477235 RepID=UPI001E4C06EF|nr:DUF4105 domain-containing protein [Stenotrophomonas sp. SY1]MCD9087831.1 DUF4105 domain-containing protein [Stenotrophomonas sp. SY1]